MDYESVEGLAQALFEESGDALFLFDPESDQILDVNSMAQRLSGFPLREMLRMEATNLFRSDTPGGAARLRQAIRKTGLFHSQEGYYLRTIQDGVWIPVNLTVSRLHVRPTTLGLITARSMREHHEVADELKKADAELRRMLAAVSGALWSADIDEAGQFTLHYFSPVVERIAGQPPAFFLTGLNRWWSIVHPEDQPRWERSIVRVRGGQPSREEYRIVWPDGSLHWVREQIQVSRATEDAGLHADGLIVDVTHGREQDEAGRAGAERWQALVEKSPVLASLKDAEGRFVYANPAFTRLAGSTPGDLLGKTDLDIFPAEEARRLREADAAVLAQDRPQQTVERLPGADGRSRRWLVLRLPVVDAAGRRLLGSMAIEVPDSAV